MRREICWTMRSVQLQSALTAFIDAAVVRLGEDLDAGAEIPFELDQQPRQRGARGPSLYCYRPLTAEFIAARRAELEALPQYAEAARLMGAFEGLDRYLVSIGEDLVRLTPAARVRVAIAALLGDVFLDQSDFELRPERLQAALAKLQSTTLESSSQVTIVATLLGMTITTPELALTGGLTIAQVDALEGLPAGARAREGSDEHLVVVLNIEDPDPGLAIDRGRGVLADVLRALRLFGDGRVGFGALAWGRVGAGGWFALPLSGRARPHGMLVVTPEQEDELRAFCNLVSRRAPAGNELAWALRRFEMGCERDDLHEALSDNLMALRALLEPEGPSSGLLAPRLAALCATPEQRATLIERAGRAQALERAIVTGAATGHPGAVALARDTADHLRALLRDVICGHLDQDLVGLADELLLADNLPPEPQAAPAEPVPAEPVAAAPAPVGPAARGAITAAPPTSAASELLGDPSEAEEILDLFV
jgi:hypothetical protein